PTGNTLLAALPTSCGPATSLHRSALRAIRCMVQQQANPPAVHASAIDAHQTLARLTASNDGYTSRRRGASRTRETIPRTITPRRVRPDTDSDFPLRGRGKQ